MNTKIPALLYRSADIQPMDEELYGKLLDSNMILQ